MIISILLFFLRTKILDFNLNNLKFNNKFEIECGIFSFSNKNSSSSLYLIFLLIFLIFDLEIILIILISLKIIKILNLVFFSLILLRLNIELFENSLKWND